MPVTRRSAATLLTAGLILAGARQPGMAEAGPVTIFAAASLQTALDAIVADWQRETGRRARLVYAASSALARQIEQGAPADLFASADLDWMDWAVQRGLVRAETREIRLENALVLIEPAALPPGQLTIGPGFPLAQALADGRLATGNVEAVPAGRYAREALTWLGVWAAVAPRVAGAENVRAALAWVARGEARFGIVYATDARSEPRVRVVGTFPPASHAPILYPFALTAATRHPDAARLMAHLSSPAAIRIFEAEGFRFRR